MGMSAGGQAASFQPAARRPLGQHHLFATGRQAMAILWKATAVSATLRRSLVVLLVWFYSSSAVLLFGAATAKAVEQQRVVHETRRVRPPVIA